MPTGIGADDAKSDFEFCFDRCIAAQQCHLGVDCDLRHLYRHSLELRKMHDRFVCRTATMWCLGGQMEDAGMK